MSIFERNDQLLSELSAFAERMLMPAGAADARELAKRTP
jgi:hypothetical protein